MAGSEAIPNIKIFQLNDELDFIGINGQSGNYDIALVSLLNSTIDESSYSLCLLEKEIKRLNRIKDYYEKNKHELKCLLTLQMKSSYGAVQIPWGIGE